MTYSRKVYRLRLCSVIPWDYVGPQTIFCYSNEHNIKVLETRIGLNINLFQGMGDSLSDIDLKKEEEYFSKIILLSSMNNWIMTNIWQRLLCNCFLVATSLVFGTRFFLIQFCSFYVLIFSSKCFARIFLVLFSHGQVFSQTYVNSSTFLVMESIDVMHRCETWKKLIGNAEVPLTWDMIYEIQLSYAVLFICMF